jgi:nitrous oxidase accessory protein NosD
MKLLKGQIRFFGRTIPVFTLTLLMLIGVGSAALLVFYGQITGNVTLMQSVKMDDMVCTDETGTGCTASYSYTAYGGETYIEDNSGNHHKVTNGAGIPLYVSFATTCKDSGDNACGDEIVTTYHKYTVIPSFTPEECSVTVPEGQIIQSAVDSASDGDVICVEGVHREQIIINKNIVLQGLSGAKIEAPDVMNTYTFPESTKTWKPIIFAFGGTETGGDISGTETVEVTVKGFEIDGRNKGETGSRFAAILFRNVKPGTISHNNIDDLFPATGNPETFGIIVQGDSDVIIRNNYVTGYNRGGIGVNGDADSLADPNTLVDNNIVVGNGVENGGGWAENGIQIGWGATGTVINNEVSLNGWPGSDWAATGILIAGSSNIRISNNTVRDNENGISVVGYEDWKNAPAQNNEITDNTIIRNKYGVTVEANSQGTSIERNEIFNNSIIGIGVYGYDVGWESSEPTGTVIHDNNIKESGEYGAETGIYGSDSDIAETVDATQNYWVGNAQRATGNIDVSNPKSTPLAVGNIIPSPVQIPASGMLKFDIITEFAPATLQDTYTITTQIVPY